MAQRQSCVSKGNALEWKSRRNLAIEPQPFSAKVELPCRLFCGPDATLEISGLVVNIDSGRLVLALPEGGSQAYPDLGEFVRLELQLPVKSRNAGTKYLNVRGRVARTTEMPDGSRELELKFRRASFKDRPENGNGKPARMEANGWKM